MWGSSFDSPRWIFCPWNERISVRFVRFRAHDVFGLYDTRRAACQIVDPLAPGRDGRLQYQKRGEAAVCVGARKETSPAVAEKPGF